MAAIMLNTFYQKNCADFISSGSATTTCQSSLDLVLVFLTAVAAGAVMSDWRLSLFGFLLAHLEATIIFIGILLTPSTIGILDPVSASAILSRVTTVAFASQFPFAIFLSLAGSPIGAYLGEKLLRDQPAQSPALPSIENLASNK